jgi:hypothetical protein
MAEMYGTWEENFQQLLNWKAAMMEKSPDSVIELDVHMVGGKMYFRRFFCALGPYTQGFREGCRPYLSVDSTALNGRSLGQRSIACSAAVANKKFAFIFNFRCPHALPVMIGEGTLELGAVGGPGCILAVRRESPGGGVQLRSQLDLVDAVPEMDKLTYFIQGRNTS